MVIYKEPIHDNRVRTTATSRSEGRLKESYLTRKKKRKLIMAGIGGCKWKRY